MTDYLVPTQQLKYILITVLLLNLLFWSAVILWRIYILKRARGLAREQRRAIQGVANPSMLRTTPMVPPREQQFVLDTTRNDLPPSYDEAIKYPSISIDMSPTQPSQNTHLEVLNPRILAQEAMQPTTNSLSSFVAATTTTTEDNRSEDCCRRAQVGEGEARLARSQSCRADVLRTVK
ncbi:uncharacterized protein LOC135385910 isoform X3 [Ornithodoros turicata]|uniref:uncharacterized protein LOC135385910 isoform X3 n=1 Tax=Ornithodoros turicata TaxID=34597 RepID=UPI0031389E75